MAIEITGYKYIQHKLKTRPWGCECQFTFVSELDGRTFNDIVSIPNLKIEEKDLVLCIEERLKLISAPRLPDIPEVIVPPRESVEKYLRDNAIIKPKHTLEQVKIAMAVVIEPSGGK